MGTQQKTCETCNNLENGRCKSIHPVYGGNEVGKDNEADNCACYTVKAKEVRRSCLNCNNRYTKTDFTYGVGKDHEYFCSSSNSQFAGLDLPRDFMENCFNCCSAWRG